MRRRADLHTLAGPYALNALPPRDHARFGRHLAACAECAEEVPSLRETAARLAGATAVLPAGRLRERVLAEAARTRQLPPAPAARRPVRAGRWVSWPPPLVLTASAVAVACLVAAVVFGSMALATRHSLNEAQAREHMLAAVLTAPDARMMSVPVAGGGTATIVMSHRMHALALSTAGLRTLPAGEGYELWLMGPPRDRSAAMLPRPAHGMTAPVIAAGLRPGDMVELTVEPAGGSSRPTAEPVLLVAP